MIRLCLLAACLLMCAPAMAGTAYQCTDAGGKVSFQDKPCAGAQRQQVLHLDDSQPVATPAAETSTAPVFQDVPPPPAPRPFAPLPVMYACVRATDGKTYTSDNGQPQPYQVPYGMLGDSQLSLAQAYSGPGAAGASAPELSHVRPTAGLIANHYVWVQDQCRPLTRAETCRALRDAYDDTEEKLRRAFKSDQPPLEQREHTLREQLQSC